MPRRLYNQPYAHTPPYNYICTSNLLRSCFFYNYLFFFFSSELETTPMFLPITRWLWPSPNQTNHEHPRTMGACSVIHPRYGNDIGHITQKTACDEWLSWLGGQMTRSAATPLSILLLGVDFIRWFLRTSWTSTPFIFGRSPCDIQRSTILADRSQKFPRCCIVL